jgi:carbonic anhydrase
MLGAAGVAASGMTGCALLEEPESTTEEAGDAVTNLYITTLSRESRDAMSSDDILQNLLAGNGRYVNGKMRSHDYLHQKRATAAGQFPSVAMVSCIDSHAPAEIIFDATLGEAFNARVAGNVANADILGSLEYSCVVAGAKVIMVLGHTSCGAIKGAIDNVDLGYMTELLAKIQPAVAATTYAGDRSSKNAEFVDMVAVTNIRNTLAEIRANSQSLSMLEHQGKIRIVGALYHLVGGRVELLA